MHVTLRHGDVAYNTVISASRTCVIGLAWRLNEAGDILIGLVRQNRIVLPLGLAMRQSWDETLDKRNRPALHLLGDEVWSLPGGFTEPHVQDYGREAIREVREELGCEVDPESVTEIGCPFSGVSFEGQHHPIFAMQATREIEQQLDEREGTVTTRWVTLMEAQQMIASGMLRDPLSVTGIAIFSFMKR
jgi:ADP-ribose pyrophosphatase YjhB (NUDIX family)